MDTRKLDYLAISLGKRLVGRGCTCPNCSSKKFRVVDRKYIVTQLRRCENCHLLYRAPTDNTQENRRFYQRSYVSGFTTELPSNNELARMKANGFAGADHDYGYYISILRSLGLGVGHRLFDFGCSWGYGSWRLTKAGFNVLAYEISQPRAQYARDKLGVDVLAALPSAAAPDQLIGTFDCFFSCHVIEHVPQPSAALALARTLLRPGGYFVAITPNGSPQFRLADPNGWHRLWGKVHPNLIDNEFWERSLVGRPAMLATSPVNYDCVARFHRGELPLGTNRLDGSELLCLARP